MKKSKKQRPEQEIWIYREKKSKKVQKAELAIRNLDIKQEELLCQTEDLVFTAVSIFRRP